MMKSLIGGLAAALLIAGVAHAQDAPNFVDIFADAETVTIDGQVAGTYDAKNELLLKLRNNDQYAVPMAAGADLSAWRTNELIRVKILQGIVVDVRDDPKGEAGYTYEADDAWAEVDGIPSDLVVRRVTLTSKLDKVDRESGAVTFTAPDGEVRTVRVADPEMLKALDIEAGEEVDVTYFDAVGVERR